MVSVALSACLFFIDGLLGAVVNAPILICLLSLCFRSAEDDDEGGLADPAGVHVEADAGLQRVFGVRQVAAGAKVSLFTCLPHCFVLCVP